MAGGKMYLAKARRGYKPKKRRATYKLAPRMGVTSGIPRNRVSTMRYSDLYTLTSTTGVIAYQIMNANSVYDPDATGVGHQPISYDIMAQLYNHYTVIGSKVKVEFIDSGASSDSPGVCGVFLHDEDASPYSSVDSFQEARKGQSKVIQGGHSRPIVVHGKFSAKKFFNIKDIKDNISRIGAGIASNPSDRGCFIIWYATADGSTNTMTARVTVDYLVSWSEPKEPVES